MSMVPNALSVCATIASISAFLEMSVRAAMALPPAASIFFTTLVASSRFMSTTTTLAPSRASTVAMPSPMPRPEPVTMATLSLSSIVDFSMPANR